MAKDFPSGGCNGILPTGQRCGAIVGVETSRRELLLSHAAVSVTRALGIWQVRCRCGRAYWWFGRIRG